MEPLPAPHHAGRRYQGERKVRLGDVDRLGRLRFDALTRYTQDVSDDDTTDAGLGDDPGWVVRSTVVDQLAVAGLGERLTFVTFCSGLGKHWAERRLSVVGDAGARYEVATLWVCVDPTSGRPRPLTEQFHQLYAEAAGGRRVSARLTNEKPDRFVDDELTTEQWHLRAVDYDVYGHVNNAAYWAAVEHHLAPALIAGPLRARIEYGSGLAPAESVSILWTGDHTRLCLWWLDDGAIAASCVVHPLARDPYRS